MTPRTTKPCPFCKAALPCCASFCPYCARKVAPSQSLSLPTFRQRISRHRRLLALSLLAALLFFIGAGAALSHSLFPPPQSVQGTGMVEYTDGGEVFQLVLGSFSQPEKPLSHQTFSTLPDYSISTALPLSILPGDGEKDLPSLFFRKLKSISLQFVSPQEDSISCDISHDYTAPTLIAMCRINSQGKPGSGTLHWDLRMKNGDSIRLSQTVEVQCLPTRMYHWRDHPMETDEQLQATIRKAEAETAEGTVIQLKLPAVTYAAPLTLSRPACLYGSQEGETVFQSGIQLLWENGPSCYFHDLTFRSSGGGTGLLSRGNLHLKRCTFSGFDTGLLGAGAGTLQISHCLFTQNDAAVHLTGSPPLRYAPAFYNSQFVRNSIGLLLDHVPTELPVTLPGSSFHQNRQHIQNLCGQPLDSFTARFS